MKNMTSIGHTDNVNARIKEYRDEEVGQFYQALFWLEDTFKDVSTAVALYCRGLTGAYDETKYLLDSYIKEYEANNDKNDELDNTVNSKMRKMILMICKDLKRMAKNISNSDHFSGEPGNNYDKRHLDIVLDSESVVECLKSGLEFIENTLLWDYPELNSDDNNGLDELKKIHCLYLRLIQDEEKLGIRIDGTESYW